MFTDYEDDEYEEFVHDEERFHNEQQDDDETSRDVTLELRELERESPLTSATEDAVEDGATGDAAEKSGSRKRKTTAEEDEIAETIAQLHSAHLCSDCACSSRYCFTGNSTAKHVRLTPFLLNCWASAILAKMEGVDIETPPPPEEEKAFWPVANQPDEIGDIALLASCRRANGSKPNSASVVINNDFAGLAALLMPFLPSANNTTAAPSTPSICRPIPPQASPAKPARMNIPEFCRTFKLSDDILQCFEPLQFAGPHVLEYIENTILDQHLSIAQRASLHFAEAEWKKGKKAL
ncbi:PARP-type domain-containing protein [Mycena venus]|uniref:PARP-type domain-containing protein n=1 Tax=Mycena venus TaxID=2733690 RepID=A0A8H6Z3M2_9AGAR|nr:PARP-type domain-containing protein [Mycena venus]